MIGKNYRYYGKMCVNNALWYGSLRTERERIKDVYASFPLLSYGLLYVDWDELEEVLLLLGLDVVLVLGDGLGASDGASLRALLPAWKNEFKLKNASFFPLVRAEKCAEITFFLHGKIGQLLFSFLRLLSVD